MKSTLNSRSACANGSRQSLRSGSGGRGRRKYSCSCAGCKSIMSITRTAIKRKTSCGVPPAITGSDMSYCVYKHTSPDGKVYIGITKRNPIKRWEGGKGYKCNRYFYRAIIKFGWDNITHEILKTGLTKEEAEQEEIRLIQELKSYESDRGYNLRLGGSLASFSEEAILRMRQSHLGKKLSDEQKKKIGDAQRGRKGPCPMLGKKHSQETIKKMRIAHLGKKNPAMVGGKNHRAHGVINLDTLESFPTIIEASKKYKCNRVGITRCCEGKQETCGGYRWDNYKEVAQ